MAERVAQTISSRRSALLGRTSFLGGLELALLSLAAVQCARLFWAVATPIGPIGEWRATSPVPAAAPIPPERFAAFDPFFRLNGDAGPMQVTALDIKLFGVREDKASGRGSAIVGTPDGQQRSFAVGDEILPGVRLTAVAFDSISIERNGAAEQLFLDQSSPSETAPTRADPAPAPATQSPIAAAPSQAGAGSNTTPSTVDQ